MKLDYVSVRISYEEEVRTTELHFFSDLNASNIKLAFHRLSICYFQSDVRIACVLSRRVH